MEKRVREPLVSVIMPVYNCEKYLREALDSVINQSLTNIEIICIDDGSTDDSFNILREYANRDNRFIILKQENLHAGVARNNGLKVAKGKYLSFLDSDDIFDSSMLTEMYTTAERDQSDTVVCGFYEYDSGRNSCIKKSTIRYTYSSRSPFQPRLFVNNIFSFSSLNAWTKLFRREMFVKNDIQFSKTTCCNDVAGVCTALACSRKISIINKPFIKYRVKQSNNISAGRSKCVDGFLNAAKDLEENLKRLNLYNTFKAAYSSRMNASYKWELSLCNEQQKEDRKKLAKEILSDDLYYVLYNERK